MQKDINHDYRIVMVEWEKWSESIGLLEGWKIWLTMRKKYSNSLDYFYYEIYLKR